ncbi:MAG: hypothetical protein M0P27_05880, partial [Bacteroidales bacterium]|nr:hypothetical protein [Bacteroidales bacterium]
AGIAGSSKIGPNSIIGGQVGIADHITVPEGTTILSQSGVISNIRESGRVLAGTPAIDYKDYIKSYVIFKNLHKSKDSPGK